MILRLAVPSAEVDEVSDLLWQLGTTGVAELDSPDGPVLLAGFEPDTVGPAAVALAARGVAVTREQPVDWVAAGAAHATVHRAGPFVVAPPWLSPGPVGPGEHLVVVDPGGTFGHGGHPSTHLVLTLLPGTIRAGDRVLDVGSGSGVLSIAAARLDATVTAVDVDPEARRITGENAAANGLGADAVRVLDAGVADLDGRYGVVLANVTVDVQEALAPHLDRLAGPGRLILAGILDEQVARVTAAHPRRRLVERADRDGWSALVLR